MVKFYFDVRSKRVYRVKKFKTNNKLSKKEQDLVDSGEWEKEQTLLSESFKDSNYDALLSFCDPERGEADESDVEDLDIDCDSEHDSEDHNQKAPGLRDFQNDMIIWNEWVEGLKNVPKFAKQFVDSLESQPVDNLVIGADMLDTVLTEIETCRRRVFILTNAIGDPGSAALDLPYRPPPTSLSPSSVAVIPTDESQS